MLATCLAPSRCSAVGLEITSPPLEDIFSASGLRRDTEGAQVCYDEDTSTQFFGGPLGSL